MFKKWKEQKATKIREQEEIERQRIEKEERKLQLQKEKDDFFEGKDISDLYDEIVEKITIIDEAMREDDHALTNDYTGRAANLQVFFGSIGPTKLQHVSTFYTFSDDSRYYDIDYKKGDNVSETCYRVLTGYYSTGGRLFRNNFRDIYWEFKIYEKKFPESLKLRFELM
jgi:hypothetical protein